MRGMCLAISSPVRSFGTCTISSFPYLSMAWSSFQALIGLVDHGNVFGLFTIENGEVHGGLGSSGATKGTAWLVACCDLCHT